MPLINIKLAKPMPSDEVLENLAAKITDLMVSELGKNKDRIVINFEGINPAHISFGGKSVASISKANLAPLGAAKWHKQGSLNPLKIGIITCSDRASRGEYEDLGAPAIWEYISALIDNEISAYYELVEDSISAISTAINKLAHNGCDLILTTGGTGPAKRDVTPEATLEVCDRLLDGYAELMRAVSLKYVPTAILSRQIAAVCGKSLVINLPGNPKAIAECLEPIWPALPYTLDLIGAGYINPSASAPKAFKR